MALFFSAPCGGRRIGAPWKATLALALSASMPGAGEVLTRESFLNEVRSKNSSYRAVSENREAAGLERSQGELLTSTQAFGNASHLNDKSPTLLSDFQGTERRNTTLELGLQKQTRFGLQGRLFLNNNSQRTIGASLLGPGQDELTLQSYNLELKLPVWKNGFGRDVRLRQESSANVSEASRKKAELELLELENRASLTYLKLSRVRTAKRLVGELTDQGEGLVAWVQRRVNARLLEESDLAQAQAALSSRKLQLEAMAMEEAELEREFNLLRDQEDSRPIGELEPFSDVVKELESLKVSADHRKDLAILKLSVEAEQKEIALKKEDFLPEIALTTRLAAFTKQSDLNDTRRCLDPLNCSQVYVGVAVAVPLDFASASEGLEAVNKRMHAKKLALAKSEQEARVGFAKLTRSRELLRKQLALSRELVAHQNKRLAEERRKQRLGRSSTFDLIRAEQERAEAELSRLGLVYSFLEVTHQLRFYEESL